MNKEQFIEDYLQRSMKDTRVKEKFEGADEDDKRRLTEELEYSLESAYNERAQNYFEKGGIGKYLSTFLRATGAVNNMLGTYLFWTMGGAGLGLKGIGLFENSLADVIDRRRVSKNANIKLTDMVEGDLKITAETIVERAAAYSPFTFGVGELADFLRGKRKFDGQVLGITADYGIEKFLDYQKIKDRQGPRIVSLDNFRNPNYSEEHTEKINDYRAVGKRKTG